MSVINIKNLMIGKKTVFGLLVIILFFSPLVTEAFLTVTPGKMEIRFEAGQITKTKTLTFLNGFKYPVTVNLNTTTVEAQAKKGIIFKDEENFEWLILSERNFEILPGEMKTISVTFNHQQFLMTESFHGAILADFNLQNKAGSAMTSIKNRIGVLVFVSTAEFEGQAEGELKGIRYSGNRLVVGGQAERLSLEFENKGDTYLNPYGVIEIKNLRGKIVHRQIIDPWFVLPETTRFRDFDIPALSGGWYKVGVSLNRGYNNVIDKKFLRFVVIPSWVIWLSGFLLLVLFIKFVFYIRQK
ncbi:MAG: hypothetical protein ACOCU8_00550 [Patescibacteria group bacterium]